MWWRVGKSKKNPQKVDFFLFFQTTTISGWTVTAKVDTTHNSPRSVVQQTSCPARNPPPSAKKKPKNVCVSLYYFVKTFFQKSSVWWCDGSVSTIRNIPCCLSHNESIYYITQHKFYSNTINSFDMSLRLFLYHRQWPPQNGRKYQNENIRANVSVTCPVVAVWAKIRYIVLHIYRRAVIRNNM